MNRSVGEKRQTPAYKEAVEVIRALAEEDPDLACRAFADAINETKKQQFAER